MKNLNVKQQLSKQTLIVVGLAVGGLLLGLIGYVVMVSPAKARLATVNKELDVARTSLITAENTPAPTKQPPVHASDIFQLTKAMPNSDNWPGIILAVTQLAKQSNVKLTSVSPGDDASGPGYTVIPVGVDVSGSYADVTRFLQRVKHSVDVTDTALRVHTRLFVSSGVTLASPDGKSVTATVALSAFAYTPAAPAAAAPPAGTTATTTTTSG